VIAGQDTGVDVTPFATGDITANGIETINVVSSTEDDDGATITLSADDATTVSLSGASDLVLTTDAASVAVDTVDASAMTGNLTYAASNASMTVIGGSGDDNFLGGDLTSLTGGDGADTFTMNVSTVSNSYSTIEDLSSGDVIVLAVNPAILGAGTTFASDAITLAGTATFNDYADAAANSVAGTVDGASSWFQFDGNTYIVSNVDALVDSVTGVPETGVEGFEDGVDAEIAIAGLIDLSTASYNSEFTTLEIA
jgi:hypothetical protein